MRTGASLTLAGGALALTLAAPPAAPPSAPCYAPYSGLSRTLETPCSRTLASGGGVEVREYGAFAANTSVIALEAAAAGFDAAVTAGARGLFEYFLGNNSRGEEITRARTVPLLVHPTQAGAWSVEMALAPSLFPSAQPPEGVPAPVYPTEATDFGLATGLIAAFPVLLPAPAREADFKFCVDALRAMLPSVAKGAYRVLETGLFTPSYAYYYGEAEKRTYEIECWVEVEKA
jgi:hypothetical protein